MNRQEKLIAEIHNEFDTAQDRLLKQANEVLSKPIDTGVSAIESVGERLAKVGFTNTPTVKKAEKIKESKDAQIKTVVETREQAPLLHRITLKKFQKRICVTLKQRKNYQVQICLKF